MTLDKPPVQPAVLTWFKVYCGVLCFIYLCLAAGSLVFFLTSPEEMEMSPTEKRIAGTSFLVAGLLFFGIFVTPFFVAARPWAWTYGLVLIALGMTSACFLPACIPLLIFWLKPEAKACFGKAAVE